MAAVDLAEVITQIKDKLGLLPTAVEKMSKAVGKLDLNKEETDRLIDTLNVELVRIYAERHIAETVHRVPHDEVETPDVEVVPREEFPQWPAEIKGATLAVVDPVTGEQTVTTRNQQEYCPDCGRLLVGARDQDTPVPVLICSRLAGLRIGLDALTPHDIVACGLVA